MTEIVKLEELRRWLPPLRPAERAALEHSVVASGGPRDALKVAGIGGRLVLIDGYNRHEICSKHDLPYRIDVVEGIETVEQAREFMVSWAFSRRSLTAEQGYVVLGKLLALQREAGGEGDKASAVAAMTGRSRRTVMSASNYYAAALKVAEAIEGKDPGQGKLLLERLESGEVRISHRNMLKLGGMTARQQVKAWELMSAGHLQHLAIGTARREDRKEPGFSAKPKAYSVVYADPPWRYESPLPGIDPEESYRVEATSKLALLPVEKILAADVVMFLWSPYPKIGEAIDLGRAWGFRHVSGVPWRKTRFIRSKYGRSPGEVLLIFERGLGLSPAVPPFPNGEITSTEYLRGSEKPMGVRLAIQEAFPDEPKIELFARTAAEGWDAYGDEIEIQQAGWGDD